MNLLVTGEIMACIVSLLNEAAFDKSKIEQCSYHVKLCMYITILIMNLFSENIFIVMHRLDSF